MKFAPFLLSLAMLAFGAGAEPVPEVQVKGGVYTPFFQDKGEVAQPITDLSVDKFPVTNQEFLRFVKANPEWRKSARKTLFADSGYLEQWRGDFSFNAKLAEQPVTGVSWFAARAYCESQHKRLLTIAEWEYVSDAQNPEALSAILEWYGRPATVLRPVAQAKTNRFGLAGIHGLIWEWVEDFSAAIVAGDSRSSGEGRSDMFCGSGAMKAKDPSQYATFMRFAYRSSLKAASTGRSLGFRCARGLD